MNIEIIKSLKERAKEMLKDNYDRKIGDEEIYTIICELENFYTAYEKEKRLAEANLKDSEEFQDNMCNHRCILNSEIEELKQGIEKEKEKNKRYEKYLKSKDKQHEQVLEYLETEKENEYISKEKIKERIKEYYEYDKRMQNKPDWHTTKYYEAKALEKLLEE